jgi:predicted acyl esterase
MQPSGLYEVRIPLGATSNYFGSGHRVPLEISSSNFPTLDRNLSIGGVNTEGTRWVLATNRVHHSAARPSRVTLTVLSQ